MTIPSTLIDVYETFGLRVTLTLMQHWGGQEVELPRRGPNGKMVEVFGEELAQELSHFLGGQRIYVPHGRTSARKESLRSEVKRLEKTGMPRHDIAAVLRISQRWVRKLANEEPPPSDTLPLFPDD